MHPAKVKSLECKCSAILTALSCLHLLHVNINYAFVRTLWLRKRFLYQLNPTSIEMHFQLEIRIQVFVVFLSKQWKRLQKEWKHMVQGFTTRGASHCHHKILNLATASSNSQWHFYHSGDFDSVSLDFP